MADKKWRLKWSGSSDTPALKKAAEKCREFPLFKDSEAHLITHEEYMELVEKDEIEKPESYWQISKGRVGLVALSYYSKYTDTWERIVTCKDDFMDGWRACEKNRKE